MMFGYIWIAGLVGTVYAATRVHLSDRFEVDAERVLLLLRKSGVAVTAVGIARELNIAESRVRRILGVLLERDAVSVRFESGGVFYKAVR